MSAIVRTIISTYADLQQRYILDEHLDAKIDLEIAVKKLAQSRTLTDMERQVIAMASSGCSNNHGAQELGVRRKKYIQLLRSGAAKIADYLCEDYNDEWVFPEVERRIGRRLRSYEKSKIKNLLYHYNGTYNTKGILSPKRKKYDRH